MTADPSTRERVLQAIVDIFIEGEKVTVSAVAVRSGLSRQRIHGEGLRPLLARFATAQGELSEGHPHLTASRLSALRTEVELFRQNAKPHAADETAPEDQALIQRLHRQVHQLEEEIARLQDEIIAERQAVALILVSASQQRSNDSFDHESKPL